MIAPPGKIGSTEGKSRDRLREALDRSGVSERTRLWLSVVAALFVLNLSLTFHNVWPTLWVTTRHELSVEIAVLLFALSLYSGVGKLPSRAALTGLSCLLLVFCIGRYVEVTAPALYGRQVNLYWDAPHVLNVVAMLNEAASPALILAVWVGLIALLIALFSVLRWSLSRVRESLRYPLARRSLGALSATLIALYAVGYTPSPIRTLSWFSLPVSATYWRQAEFTLNAYQQVRNPTPELCEQSAADFDFSRVNGADVVVVFLESYGATAYDRPEISQTLTSGREDFARAAAASGREVVSAYVRSPTFGGASWLAHMSLLTGRPVQDNGTYNLLLTQNCEVLTDRFSGNGYRVVALMPGLKRNWPEGVFYGFDEIYGERALDYNGPDFGWWRIPDQHALAKLDQLELAGHPRAPRFVFFPTISSHMPFRPTPPYQPDWSRLLTHEPYEREAVIHSLAVEPDWTDLSEDYAATIAYAFDYLSGYLRQRDDLDLVLVLLGDHQPPASVSGQEARWDVPVHVIASREEILKPLLDAGFVPGLTPEYESIGPMHQLTSLLFGASTAPAED